MVFINDDMRKVFMFLYPIKEFMDYFIRNDDGNIIDVLNETIDKRYRMKGYDIVYVKYPDKSIYGIDVMSSDIVIETDIDFTTHTKKQEDGSYIYPDETYVINKLGQVDELVVSGFHFRDCVRKVAEVACASGISTLVDLDLTDLFLNVYKTNYFNISEYDPNRFKEYMLSKYGDIGSSFALNLFNRNYSSVAYGFNKKRQR